MISKVDFSYMRNNRLNYREKKSRFTHLESKCNKIGNIHKYCHHFITLPITDWQMSRITIGVTAFNCLRTALAINSYW